MERLNRGQSELEIEFERNRTSPSRVFSSMAHMIDSFSHLDTDLICGLGFDVMPELLLEDVEAGSLKARLRSIIAPMDGALKKYVLEQCRLRICFSKRFLY